MNVVVLDLRTVAEYVHRELNGNASTSPHNNARYRGGQTAATSGHPHQPPGQPVGVSGSTPSTSGLPSTVSNNVHPGVQLHQSPLVRPPIFTRLLSIVRGFLRSFGIRIWECLWSLPIPNVVAWFTLSSRPKNHKQEEHLDQEEVGEEDPDDKSGAEIKGDKKPQPQVQLQNHQHQNNKKQPKPKRTVSRKKSLPTVLAGNNHNNSSNNDLDEASSTTTESSAVDDLNDNTTPNQSNKQQNSEQGKNNKKKTTQKPTQVKNNSEQQQQNNTSNATASASKKKAKKQNSVEGKKTSPEMSMGASSNPETIAKVAPVTGSSKKPTPVTPLPTKPRQSVQSSQDLNHQDLQHQPLQNLSQQNNQLTNATENNGVQQQKKVTPVGKILPAIKPPENHGAQFGPVGAKPPMKPSWNNSGRNNDLNDVHGNGYGVPGSHGQSGPVTGNGNPSEDIFTGSNSNGSSPSRGGPSLMTQLQMNRKQETAQFLAGLTRNDWPGFSESTPTSGGLQNPELFLANLWDTPDTTQTIGQPTNIWGNNGLWSDAGLGRGNQQHNATPTSTNYIGGLSVLGGGGAQTQQAPPTAQAQQQNYQFLRSDLNHETAEILRRNTMTTQPQNDAGPSGGNGYDSSNTGGNGYNGFNPLGMTSIWSNTQNQQPQHEIMDRQQGQTAAVSRNNSSSDELNNQFREQQNRALNLQAQSTASVSVTTVASTLPAATAPSMNTTNSWSNTLFRNK